MIGLNEEERKELRDLVARASDSEHAWINIVIREERRRRYQKSMVEQFGSFGNHMIGYANKNGTMEKVVQ